MCRSTILRTLGIMGDEETINEAKSRFEQHLKGQLIQADLRAAVYAAVLAKADESTVNKFIELHDSSDLQEERMRIAVALGFVSDKDLINKVLKFAVSVNINLKLGLRIFLK